VSSFKDIRQCKEVIMSSKERREHVHKKRGKRVDYKLLNDDVGDEVEESFWTKGHIIDLKLLSGDVHSAETEVITKHEDEGNSDKQNAEGAIGPDVLEMR
jgi:hypothetical protein